MVEMKYPEENESLDLVDKNDNVIGKATREECHKKGLLHRVVIALVLNKDYKIFVSKRSKNKYYCPGHWAIPIGGHVESEETYEDALKRELDEELGIVEEPIELGKYTDKSDYDKEIRKVFYVITDKKIKLNKFESEKGSFITFEELEEKIEKEKFIPSTDKDLKFLTNLLKQKGIIK